MTEQEKSVHDNVLVGYAVHCVEREIVLHTEYRDRQPIERTDILFRGVEGYFFQGDNFSTIIFDVVVIPIEDVLHDNKELFDEGRPYCWPGAWNKSEAALRAYLAERGVQAFSLSSSYGMSGWILAKSMERISKDENRPA